VPLALGAWEGARTAPGERPGAAELDDLAWAPAQVPGTTAELAPGIADPDAWDWWFRAPFDAQGSALLRLDGLATVADVYVNGELVLHSTSMFLAHAVELSGLSGRNELAICCRALSGLLAEPRRPRARWRTRLVADGNLRWWRTSLIGRTPGFSPVAPIAGPWRPVTIEPLNGPRIDGLRARTRLDGDDGIVEVAGVAVGAGEVELTIAGDSWRAPAAADGSFAAELRVSRPARWWPHTHGEPALHELSLRAAGHELAARRVGFRELAAGPAAGHDVMEAGLDLHVNGVRVFARGALWTHLPDDDVRGTLLLARDAGMNMLRVPGTGVYEPDAFHDACDELGLLVWQDFMFANLDYPVGDPEFRALVEQEAAQVCDRLASHPSIAVLCGNSEVEQQVTMLGLDPELGRGELFGELLPAAARAAGADAVYVPSAPSGSGLPIRPDRGVAGYFGVGGYRRPIEDVRRAGVRFAAECLALANVPADDPADRTAGVPRDVGADWDFADVRDHYLALLHGVDPAALHAEDPGRYYELSRVTGGEVMAEVFGEWRRAGSPCGGGLILWLRDVVPGSGWGVIDASGRPKPAWDHLRRALAPLALWSTDEGLGGIELHLANDGPAPVRGALRVALYRDGEVLVGEATQSLELAAHATADRNVEELLGRFVDAAWAYRFGPPQQDAVVAGFDTGAGAPLITVRFPAGPPAPSSASELGLEAELTGDAVVELRSRRLVHAVRVHAAGFAADDGGFTLEPGAVRRVRLTAVDAGAVLTSARVRAANLQPGIDVRA
jgi:beta-mannosidase